MPSKGMIPSARLHERLRQRRFKTCSVSWCQEPARGLSQHCAKHYSMRRATGDPEGRTLRRSHVRQHAERTRAYILHRRGHAAIEAGLSWSASWLSWGRHYSNDWRGLDPSKQARQYLHRLSAEGVHEADVLATIAAIAYIRQYEQGYLRSDEHWQFQTVLHVIGLVSWPTEERGGSVRRRYIRPTPKAVAYLFQSIPPSILALTHSIAQRIEEEQTGPGVNAETIRLVPL